MLLQNAPDDGRQPLLVLVVDSNGPAVRLSLHVPDALAFGLVCHLVLLRGSNRDLMNPSCTPQGETVKSKRQNPCIFLEFFSGRPRNR